jgi:hypothetical protein
VHGVVFDKSKVIERRLRLPICAEALGSREAEYFRACQSVGCGSEKSGKKKRERRPLF